MAFWNRNREGESREVESREVEIVERRDPTAATRSLQWTTPGRVQPPNWDASHAFERAYYSNIAVYACFQAVASVVSTLPFRVGADPEKPNDYDPAAPLARLLGPPPGGPNPNMSAEALWHFAIVQRLATGRFGWEIETPPGQDTPIALWPLVSSSLKPVPSTSGTAWFDKFTYGRPGDERKLERDAVFYDWQPRGSDFRQPESALEAAALDVNIAVMQSRYDYAFLKNDARPAALVVTESFEDEDSFAAFRDQWNASYGGPNNAGRSAFVEADPRGDQGVKGAVDVTVLGISPKDAQAAQRYSDRLQQIAIGLGVPWSRLDASGRTFDNASQEDLIWWEQRLLPLIRQLQSAVNIQLAPRLGNKIGWFDLSKVRALQDVPDFDATGAVALVGAGIATKNEARARFKLPPVDNGDALETAPEPAPVPMALAAAAPEPEERKLHDYKGDGGPCELCGKPAVHQAHGYYLPMTKSAEPEVREPPAVDHEARRAKLWNTTQGKVRNLERQWERALRKMFARQARSVIARLEGKRGRGLVRSGEIRATADEVFDPQHWVAETTDDLEALYEAVTAAGGARVSDLFGLAFDLEAQYAQDFVQARANQLAGQVTETTYNAIKDALAEGVGEGESIPDLAIRLKAVFEEASTTRAVTIARTEVISAFNGAATLTATQYGRDVVAGKEWIATQDSRTREWHAERDGEIVDIGADFSGGIPYPGVGPPDEVVNCRCTVAFLTPEDMDARAGGRSRMVEGRLAHALVRAIRPGMEESAWRAILEVAA